MWSNFQFSSWFLMGLITMQRYYAACDTNLHPISHFFRHIAEYQSEFYYRHGCLFSTHSLGNLWEYYHKSYIVKNWIIWDTFLWQYIYLPSTIVTLLAPKATDFGCSDNMAGVSFIVCSPLCFIRARFGRLPIGTLKACLYTVSQKMCCRIFAITSSNVNRFWKFFYHWKQQ